MAHSSQLGLFKPRGGKRRGAGRKPVGPRAGACHRTRPKLPARFPVHVVLRAAPDVGNLRQLEIFLAIREATRVAARREDFRIVELSVQRSHVHLIVEASDKIALARGMQGFQVSAARRINAALARGDRTRRRRGSVFPDRYHAGFITSPRQARHTIAYVLANWRKHQEDRRPELRGWKLDWFSSAPMFAGWTERTTGRTPIGYEPLCMKPAQTWLMREGWKKCSPTISMTEIPSMAKR
jgi:putative transposase